MVINKEQIANQIILENDPLIIGAGVLIFTTAKDRLRIALTESPVEWHKKKWCVPCITILAEETADEAAYRCLKNATGLTDVAIEQLYTFSDVYRNPFTRVIMTGYIAMVPEAKLNALGTDCRNRFTLFDILRTEDGFTLRSENEQDPIEIDESVLLFDYAKMIRAGLDRMAGKIDYSEIGFRFLNDPMRFTLTDLRHIYDAIKGVQSDIGNFRRFIKTRYITTGKIVNNDDDRREMEHAGRPASTYRYTGTLA